MNIPFAHKKNQVPDDSKEFQKFKIQIEWDEEQRQEKREGFTNSTIKKNIWQVTNVYGEHKT